MNKFRNIRLLLALVVCLLSFSVIAFADDAKSAYDLYQSKYQSYREAIENNADQQTITRLASELQAACQAYYRSIGVETTYDQSVSDSPSFDSSNSDGSVQAAETTMVRRTPSAQEKKFTEILAAINSPDKEKNLEDIQKRLEDFIAECTDAELKKEAVFQLSEIVYEKTGSLARAQEVLLGYARNAANPELRRQALAKIRVFRRYAIVQVKREEYRQILQETVNDWGNYSKTSWFATPVKAWKLGAYAIKNIQRRAKARELDQALKEYDKAVLETYPAGSADALTRSRLVPLNRVRVLVNGRTSYHYRFEHASRAQSSLYVQTLLYQDDETGNKLADIMCEKAQSGVDVRLILDDFFSFGKKGGVIQRLRNAGVKVLINNPILKNLAKANFRSHQKLFIVDETIAIVGGMNTGDEYAKGEITEYGWRDTDIELQGPIVREILDLFERNWEDLTLKKRFETGAPEKYKQAKEDINQFKPLKNVDKLIRGPLPVYFEQPPVFDNVSARFVITTPIIDKDDNILDLFEIYLGRAKKEVIFETGYFIPTKRLVDAIAAACARGVSVKILTNSIESNNHPYGGLAGRVSYEQVLRSGARIFEWQGAQTMHSKVSLFDDFAVTIGAYNINSRSHTSDSEDVIALEDARVANVFRYVLNKDLSRSREITLDEALSWNKDLMKKAKMNFFNLFKFMF